MSIEILSAYETADLVPSSIPPRSRLYPLEPVSLGKSGVESITSYLIRLAYAHSVTVVKLATREFTPLLNKEKRTVFNKFSRETHNLNGAGDWTGMTIKALEQLTLRNDVCFLTMYPWRKVVSRINLLRPYLAWCPMCYQVWQQSGQDIYHPLLWNLSVVQICPEHQQALYHRCPYEDCQKHLPLIDSRVKPGHCPFCKRWLGMDAPHPEPPTGAKDKVNWQLFAANQVAEMLATGPGLTTPLRLQTVTQNINVAIAATGTKSIRKLAREMGLSQNLFHQWIAGRHPPSLDRLLRFCYHLDLRLPDILTSPSVPHTCFGQNTPALIPPHPRQKIESNSLRCQLEHILNDDQSTPASIEQVARQTGVPPHSLKRHCPELYRRIIEQHEQYQQTRRQLRKEKLESDLRAILESDQTPPPSLREVGRRLQIPVPTARQVCPELCRLVSGRRKNYYRTRKSRIEVGLKKLIEVQENPPPSIAEAVAELGESVTYLYWNFPDLCCAVTRRYRSYRQTHRQTQPVKHTEHNGNPPKDHVLIHHLFADIIAAGEKPPPSLTKVAGRLDCSLSYLRRRHSALASQLKQQQAIYHQAKISEWKCKLEEVIARNELPPPSLKKVAEQIGEYAPILQKRVPELCAQIIERYQSYHQAEKQRRKASLDQIISEKPVLPPSLSQVAGSLNCGEGVLPQQFPDASQIIIDRYAAYQKKKRLRARKALEAALICDQNPPPRLIEVAGQLGYQKNTYLLTYFPDLCHQLSQRYQESRRQNAQVKLEAILADDQQEPPLTLEEISVRLGYSCASLEHHCPELCQAIKNRHQDYWHAKKLAVKQMLEAILNEEIPVVSVQTVAKRFAYPADTVRRYFPNLATAVSEKYKIHSREKGEQRRKQLREMVKRITTELYYEGKKPTLQQIFLRLPKPGVVRDPQVRQVWRDTLDELGITG